MSSRLVKSFEVKVEGLDQLDSLRKLIGNQQFRNVMEGIASQVTDRIRELNNPANGEFPLVTAYPVGEDMMVVEVEATAGTHAFLDKRMPEIGFHFRETDAEPVARALKRGKHTKAAATTNSVGPPEVPDLSEMATRLARLFVERSENGLAWDPPSTVQDLQQALGIGESDVADAIGELKRLGCVNDQPPAGPGDRGNVGPSARLFVKHDMQWKGWEAAKDAALVAREAQTGTTDTEEIAQKLGWPPRRMNPALEYLIERDLIETSESNAFPFSTRRVQSNDATRRFLRTRS